MTGVPADLTRTLSEAGQLHLLAGFSGLAPANQVAFAGQLRALDFALLDKLAAGEASEAAPDLSQLKPVEVESPADWPTDCLTIGESALRAGRVAALVVAGGQGSRLGSELPKGMYPVGPVTGATLFRWHAERVVALGRRYGHPLPLLVMTSPATHAPTVDYFAANDFGLAAGQIRFFQQGTMPAHELGTNRLVLDSPGKLALSPDGHGGTLTALASSGLLAELESAGVESVFYFQVDNPLALIADPAFLGRHLQVGSEVSTKVVLKQDPAEKVGVLAEVAGKLRILEYSDLPKSILEERTPAGAIRFAAGNTAIHVWSLAFLKRLTSGAGRLHYHQARKKVPYYDPERGERVTPTSENAVKHELFIFDALPLAERHLTVGIGRDEFAPLKNAAGADSPATVAAALSERGRRLLAGAGYTLPEDVPAEVSPLVALDADELGRAPQLATVAGQVQSGAVVIR